jgi:hypothetical protein
MIKKPGSPGFFCDELGFGCEQDNAFIRRQIHTKG